MPNSFERPYFSSSPPYSFGDIYLYRFSFNGKEKDNETYGNGNAYDFGARIYDCRLGRWFSVDPAYNKFPFCSPFTFALNKPILKMMHGVR